MNAKTRYSVVVGLIGIAMTLAACGDNKPAAPAANPAAEVAAKAAAEAEAPLPPSEIETQLPPAVRDDILKPFTGDLDGMVERRLVRIGVTFNRTFYFVDKGVQRGVSYEYGQLVEERLNKHVKTGTDNKVHVVFVPLPRAMLLPALVDGKVDLVAAQVTVTPELQKRVDFTNPTRMNVSQILVTGRATPPIDSVDALSGQEVFVRDSEQLPSEPAHAQREVQGRGQAAGGDSHRAGQPRGRRPARDGECRADPGHHRGRLPGELLEESLSESARSRQRRRCARAAPSPSPCARTARSCRRR